MLNMIHKTEAEYVKCFSELSENENTVRFSDDKLTDMYCHNFTYIKDKLDNEQIIELIKNEIEYRKDINSSFLRIETDFDIDPAVISELPIASTITNFDYMFISTDKYADFKGNDSAVILEASEEKVLNDGIDIEILGSSKDMKDFTTRKIHRKAKAYTSPDNKLSWYICYYNDLPIGSCELLINGGLAKIEEFSILDDYQRNGFGTAVLKHLLREAHQQGVQTAYLVTDSADTAKDMYEKCGFKKIGQKTALFFRL